MSNNGRTVEPRGKRVDAALIPGAHWKAFESRRRDPDGKRIAILQTAAQLFLDKSYSRTSVNDVAERLSITKPALYHYFRNKEEILVECYRLGTALIQEILDGIAARCGTGLEKVEAFIYSYANVMTVDFGRCVMRLDEGDLSADALAEVRANKRKIDRRLRAFIQEGIADRSIGPCDPKLAAFALAGAVNWICKWYEPDGPLAPEEIAEQFARILTRGVASAKVRAKSKVGTRYVGQPRGLRRAPSPPPARAARGGLRDRRGLGAPTKGSESNGR